jgi:DNA (cytosine-5)-methyltransferase 1
MLTFVDLFCGGGFGARGAVRGGGLPLLAVDAWEMATTTYKANFPSAEVKTARIEDLVPTDLAKEYKPDVLLTSPECTAHSIARGAKPGKESSRASALGIVDWIQAMKPRWVIVENVNRMKKWNRHNELVASIEGENYIVSDLYLNAWDFGSAQARKRMFLICSRDGHRITREDLLSQTKIQFRTAKDIINWESGYKSRPLQSPGRAKPTLERAQRAVAALGKNIPFLIVYYGSDYAGGWQSLDSPLRTITTLDRFGLVTWECGQPYLRMLQPDELKKGMGGGDDHELPSGSRREQVKLCGNGVCSEVLESIFKRITAVEQTKKNRGQAA